MPYRICKTFEVESGHILSRHPGRCRYPHGHTRRVELVLESETLDENGMIVDFKALSEALKDCLEQYDHSICMNTDDPMFGVMKEAYGERVIPFEGQDPTSEVIAKQLYDACKGLLTAYRDRPDATYSVQPGVQLLRVRVWETSTAWAEYAE
jgi:6-pyruvoyltetrahydropterin/6-carboxytetrahydropterin synthase